MTCITRRPSTPSLIACKSFSEVIATMHLFIAVVGVIIKSTVHLSISIVLVECVKEHTTSGVLVEEPIYNFVEKTPKIHLCVRVCDVCDDVWASRDCNFVFLNSVILPEENILIIQCLGER
jgi:hypothetical protein